ncbi:MAG TPA: ClbS/DfsB family four-helix bundle protein [Thermomicrobiales bacterium]|nr:ClbS/DfsB family four-helix bundle protein [Thermomicrobiales bacterium]
MTMTFDERLEMLQQASRAWLELKRAVDRIPDEAMNRPNTVGRWGGRDLLIHLANWEEVAIAVIEQLEAGGSEAWPLDDADEINASMLDPYRDSSLDEARAYLEATHFALMDSAEHAHNITESVVLGVTRDHYRQHMDDIKAIAGAAS